MKTKAILPRPKSDRSVTPLTVEPVNQLRQFRRDLYDILPQRPDAILDLLDALAGNTQARSPVELSLSPVFRRQYGSVYAAVDHFFVPTQLTTARRERDAHTLRLLGLLAERLPSPQQRKFWLFGIDRTPAPRRFAATLADRTYVHQPNTLRGNKPVTIGHDYAVCAALPEKARWAPPWLLPLDIRRIGSAETANQVALAQLQTLMTTETLPWHGALCVQVADSGYSGAPFLGPVAALADLVSIVRLAGNRVVYYAPPPAEPTPSAGHPTWYGARFDLKDAQTWGPPDQATTTTFTTRQGQSYTVQLQGWANMRVRGAQGVAMHSHPFTLVRARVLDAAGQPLHKRAMWLLVIGARCTELALVDIWGAYRQRYDLEHFFRFGKQRLLLTACQTPDDRREENWWQLVQLAYAQLWLAQPLAAARPRPWERYLPPAAADSVSPAQVQRDFGRIIAAVGTPARAPKPRGNAPGRAKGFRPPPRTPQRVIKKAAKTAKVAATP
jgi:hypothetical protein